MQSKPSVSRYQKLTGAPARSSAEEQGAAGTGAELNGDTANQGQAVRLQPLLSSSPQLCCAPFSVRFITF